MHGTTMKNNSRALSTYTFFSICVNSHLLQIQIYVYCCQVTDTTVLVRNNYFTVYFDKFYVSIYILFSEQPFQILCFVDRAYRYIRVLKTNLMHCLSSVYLYNQPLHVSGIFVAHHWEFPSEPGQQTVNLKAHVPIFVVYTLYLLMMGYKYARNM